MESFCSNFLISSAHAIFPATCTLKRCRNKWVGRNFQSFPLIVRSKRSSYQDFQEYAKPSQLLPATEVKDCKDASVGKMVSSFVSDKSVSFFKVGIQTSKIYGSGLSDLNSLILLCLIDEDGRAILQRLPATSFGTTDIDDVLHFQRGAVDEFAFVGPDFGKIAAVWISLNSGQWRIGGLSLTVRSHSRQPPYLENNPENKPLTSLQYDFEFEDILLGEKSDAPMMEFRPRSITSFSDSESTLFDAINALPSFDRHITTAYEQSMKEYSYLKFSLLLYDTMLILTGSTFAYFSAGENTSFVFLVGGLFGFFYLLLLQKSVDGISAKDFVPGEDSESFGQVFGSLNLKGSISSLALAFAFAVITLKYALGEGFVRFTPKDVIFGMMGFLMCKFRWFWLRINRWALV
ncbi:lipase/lipooxygenase [Striga asiatica]|uniref:Lipase/lipooxygenase n=1 Tax=Striga asiatica TaxID=4170 RepID=A0A5A7R202_STRAF|nr:lipase/lipooxygenase [Striga asiatica]